LKPPETAPGGFLLTACAIFERATAHVQPLSTRPPRRSHAARRDPRDGSRHDRRRDPSAQTSRPP
jgi:hypothetical protein